MNDEQVVQIINKIKIKGSAAVISIEEIVNELINIISVLVNEKNAKITELEEKLSEFTKDKKKEG